MNGPTASCIMQSCNRAIAQLKEAAKAEGMSEDDAAARVSELSRGNLDLAKLASMLPAICRGDEEKAVALLKRKGVSII